MAVLSAPLLVRLLHVELNRFAVVLRPRLMPI
jgi:hypothetical protein